MTLVQVEHVVRAFYEAEFPGPWDNPRAFQRPCSHGGCHSQPSDCTVSPVSYQGKCRVLARKIA
jgi:hypothetical protein